MSEFRIVFAEVFICPETMDLHQESLRESHFGATVARFEFPWRIGRKSEMKQVGTPWGEPGRQGRSPGFTKFAQDRRETRRKVEVQGGLFARRLRNRRSWPLLAGAIRRDWSVRNSNRFCRSSHLSRNDGIASRIVARVAVWSDGCPF